MCAQVRQMQLHDRAVLAGSKLLVGSRLARAFLAVYAVLVHLFLMVLLYYTMSAPRTRVELIDMDMVAQQQQAATQAAAEAASMTAQAAAGGGAEAGRALRAMMGWAQGRGWW